MRFDLYRFWVDLYALATGKMVGKVDVKAKVAFETKAKGIASAFGMEKNDLRYAIYYCYVHNPLGLDDVSGYGKFSTFVDGVKHYKTWAITNKLALKQSNQFDLIRRTVKEAVVEEDWRVALEELVAGYN